jgi:hypothetical protein
MKILSTRERIYLKDNHLVGRREQILYMGEINKAYIFNSKQKTMSRNKKNHLFGSHGRNPCEEMVLHGIGGELLGNNIGAELFWLNYLNQMSYITKSNRKLLLL